ncbi:DNA polymerase III subunit delta' [Sphingomonas sp.]|uniref:DNA polymerase III subunit delta' n=1 Tax=Sphingomonas sp. TaxID=28214 RepID=UPI003B00F948
MSLLGQDGAIAAFLDAHRTGRLHHAWLLAGPRGVGKGRFARAAALRLLAEAAGPTPDAPGLDVPDDHRIARLFAAGSHPDTMLLERLFREKTKDHARSISVDQVRGLSRLFATAPTFSRRRVVIVDAADDLERSGANALLKLLEEPPSDAVFLLVSHAPGRLLPTIRSRCRMLRFQSLGDEDMTAALGRAMPQAEDREIAALVAAGEGSPGRALGFAGLDVAGLDRAMDKLVARGDADNHERCSLGRTLALKAAQPRYELFLERVPGRIAAEARMRSGGALADAIAAWEKARTLAGSAVRLSLDPQATVFELAGLLASLAPQDAPRPR